MKMIVILLAMMALPLATMWAENREDGDELERWAFKYYSTDEKAKIAREEKDKLLAKIQEIREGEGT